MQFDTEFFISLIKPVLGALPVTLGVAVCSLLAAFPIGFCFAVIRSGRNSLLSKIIGVYVSLMRGTPMIVQIYVVYTGMPLVLSDIFGPDAPFNVFDVNPLIYAIVLFALNTTANFTEIFRSALASVNAGQMEAALMCGLMKFQAYTRIICPQMMKAAAANMCNESVSLIKNTSLVFYMSVKDVMGIIKTKAGIGYNFFEGYAFAFLVYLVLCLIVQGIFKMAERHSSRQDSNRRKVRCCALNT